LSSQSIADSFGASARPRKGDGEIFRGNSNSALKHEPSCNFYRAAVKFDLRNGRTMTTSFKAITSCVVLIAVVFVSAHAQFFGGGGRRSLQIRNPETIKEQEEMEKAVAPEFKEDVFTFARLRFGGDQGFGFGRGRSWNDDTPDADLSLIYRLFQSTSLKVRPGLNYVDITTKDLASYPFVYVAAAGSLTLTDDEATALRTYLLGGGFMMVDDFWGDSQWEQFYGQIKRVFPDREPVLLTMTNRIFQTVFNFTKAPQIPSVGSFLNYGLTYDVDYDFETKGHEPHYLGIYDDKQRMMVVICHNNHFGDGWEHETQDPIYFDQISEPMAYPMFINILVYAMTH
jgi:Domain of unknown function (DUF4159)